MTARGGCQRIATDDDRKARTLPPRCRASAHDEPRTGKHTLRHYEEPTGDEVISLVLCSHAGQCGLSTVLHPDRLKTARLPRGLRRGLRPLAMT